MQPQDQTAAQSYSGHSIEVTMETDKKKRQKGKKLKESAQKLNKKMRGTYNPGKSYEETIANYESAGKAQIKEEINRTLTRFHPANPKRLYWLLMAMLVDLSIIANPYNRGQRLIWNTIILGSIAAIAVGGIAAWGLIGSGVRGGGSIQQQTEQHVGQ